MSFKGDYVKVSVSDTGIGIKESDIPKVFDKFQQIESSLSREVGGTGLGLPIAKQLIEAHRGEIWLESEFKKGSKFSFILPIMMHYNTFIFELDNELQQSKYNHSGVALIYLEETCSDSIIKDISLGKINTLKESEKCKFFAQDNKMHIVLLNAHKTDAEKLINKLGDKILQNGYTLESLLVGLAIYPEDAITSDELIEQAEKSAVIFNELIKDNIKTKR
jgi:hypothetical protein